jgi:hypothetical protein
MQSVLDWERTFHKLDLVDKKTNKNSDSANDLNGNTTFDQNAKELEGLQEPEVKISKNTIDRYIKTEQKQPEIEIDAGVSRKEFKNIIEEWKKKNN